MNSFDTKILDILVKKGYIMDDLARDRLENKLKSKDHQTLEELLISSDILDDKTFIEVKAEVLGVDYVEISDEVITQDALQLIPLDVCKNFEMLALKFDNNSVLVGMVNPMNLRALESLEFLVRQKGYDFQTTLISLKRYKNLIKKYQSLDQEVATALGTGIQEQTDGKSDELIESTADGGEKKAPISKVVSVIIRHAVEAHASDIHIEPEETQTKVRYRIDGVLHTSLVLPADLHTALVSRIKVLARMKLDETRVPQDGRIRLSIDEHKIDIRVSTLPLLESEKINMRLLDRSKGVLSLDELGFTGKIKEKVEENIKKPYGMVLVTGPTGSGKTTTLYTLLNSIDSEQKNIVTLEDPIEYEIPNVNQSQVHPKIGYTFANGLRTLLRQDPDVIMVGEIRDAETAELAVHAGLTGHLIFSTLHTNNSVGAIPRLIDLGIEPFLLSSTLNLVIAQRLVRKLCEHCKTAEPATPQIITKVKELLKNLDSADYPEGIIIDESIQLHKAVGCPKCGGVGYRGRIAIVEVLDMTEELVKIINDGADFNKILEYMKKEKVLTMAQDGIFKVLKGVTTLEDVLSAVLERDAQS